MDGGPCIRMENADDPRFALNADDPRSAHPRESEPENQADMNPPGRLLRAFAEYQADMNPPGRLRSGTESEHSRIKGSNKLKDVVRRSQTLLSCTLEIALLIPLLILFKAIWIAKAKAAGASRDSESTLMANDRESEPENFSYGLQILAASVAYQAGMNPPGGFWSGSEHSRIKGSNKLKDVVRRSQKLLSCTLEIALLFPLIILFKAIGILAKAKVAGASRDSESTPMASDRESEPENYLSRRRKYLLLLAILVTSLTYQAGMNPPGGFWSGTESEHSRIKGSNELKDVVRRSQTLLSCTLEIALLITLLILFKAIGILPKAKAAGTSRDSESTPMASDRESEPENYLSGRRKYLMLLAILLASSTYQAGMNPTGGFWSGTESEHIRIKGSNELKDVVRSQTLLSCTLAIALLFTLLILFKAIGIPPNAKETGASRDYESTSMGSYREYEPENSSGSDSMVAKDNAVAETIATWHVGSASTHHATGNHALLSDVKTVDDLNIQTGDGIIMPVSGRGSVITDTVVLHDVWFVPGLKKNVVSVGQLAELDCSIVFKRDACYISGATDGTIIGKALVGENGMFKLEFLKVPLVN